MVLEENLAELGDALGLNLEPIRREAPVGDLSLDLLAKDKDTSDTVIIENQLEKAEHKHLGQLLAYAAGCEAKVVIWVSSEFRDEYRQVLEWLNEQTHAEIHFFAIVVEVVQIDGSNPALIFRVVVSPNKWKKSIIRPVDTEIGKQYRNFFQNLIDELREEHQFTNSEYARPDNWHYFASKLHSGITYCVRFSQEDKVNVYVRIYEGYYEDRLALFDELMKQKEAITKEFGGSFEWKRAPEKRESVIVFARDGVIQLDDDVIDEIRQWCVTNLLKLQKVFGPKIRPYTPHF